MTRHFSRWFGKTDLSVEALCRSVDEMERGLIDANLGGGIIKKRVALPGRGKRGKCTHVGCDEQCESMVLRIWI
ncbi:MAG TPA: type II toxin-antitoxin system RelE/ParE family toxin [Candidatus Binatia bacterium]